MSVADGSGIEPFTQARLDALQAEGRPVFVNLTAAWCITCLVNERVALATEPVRDAFRARRVAYLKGDWTNQNPEITRLLEQHGRSGVPLYLLYPGRGAAGSGEAVVLPQILTTATVLDSLEPISIGPITTSKRADADQGFNQEMTMTTRRTHLDSRPRRTASRSVHDLDRARGAQGRRAGAGLLRHRLRRPQGFAL